MCVCTYHNYISASHKSIHTHVHLLLASIYILTYKYSTFSNKLLMHSYLRVVAIDVALIVTTCGYWCIVKSQSHKLIPNAQFWYKE